MSDPCKRCGDPSGDHELGGEGTASERNCALYRIGTELTRVNQRLEALLQLLVQKYGLIKLP